MSTTFCTIGETTDAYLRELRRLSPRPVLAGFGIRSAEQVRAIGDAVDGVIVGSALIERLAAGEDPAPFLRSLRAAPAVATPDL